MPSPHASFWPRFFLRWREALIAYLVTVVAGVLFLCMSNGGDLFLYTRYASTAREHGLSGLYKRETVEYPPLATAFIVAVDRASSMFPLSDCALTRLKTYQAPPLLREYKIAHRCTMLVIFLITVWLVRRLCAGCLPEDSKWERFQRLSLFLAASVLSGYVLLDRLDLALAALIAGSLALLTRGRPTLSLVVLAAAIAFKLAPIVLVPIWLLGCLPATGLQFRQMRLALGRLSLLASCVALFCLPMYFVAGIRSLEFWNYHRIRGIEYESSYAAILFALKPFGCPAALRAAFGSADVESPLAPAMLHAAPLLVVLSGAAVFLLCVLGVRGTPLKPKRETFGQAYPQVFTVATLLAMLCLVLFNKVFSPQYVVWLLPLIPLVPLQGKARTWFWGFALGFSGVTALIFPLWWKNVLGAEIPGELGCLSGPGLLGTALLLARTALLLAMIGTLWRWLLRTIGHKGNVHNHQERQAASGRFHALPRSTRWLRIVLKSVRDLS